ncbi:MAG: hypothetical protein AAF542_08500 [Pseudomonadota bacterium]
MKYGRHIVFLVVTLLLFSLWVAFALLAVNPYLHPYIPGYKVGDPCGWEIVALAVSALTAHFWSRHWAPPKRTTENGISYVSINYRFVLFLLIYMAIAISIFLWEYAKFSAGFE